MRTPEQEKGDRFEIFLELMLKKHSRIHKNKFYNIRRNVEYHRELLRYRQVDISYDYNAGSGMEFRIIEAKYSSNGKISYHLRSPRERKEGDHKEIIITNLIDEVCDKKEFVRAGAAVLATNTGFEDKVKEEAAKHGIRIMEGTDLAVLYHQLGYEKTIDEEISSIDINRFNLHKSIIYI